jgi:hypothetical protein
MSESPKLLALRKSLAAAAEGAAPEEAKQLAQTAIRQILAAIESGVCPLGDWERRCLAAAITSLRGGRSNEARVRARQALWPEENRRMAAVSRFPARPGMMTIDELKREFAAALAMPGRRGTQKDDASGNGEDGKVA